MPAETREAARQSRPVATHPSAAPNVAAAGDGSTVSRALSRFRRSEPDLLVDIDRRLEQLRATLDADAYRALLLELRDLVEQQLRPHGRRGTSW